jgi:hypothetical protein
MPKDDFVNVRLTDFGKECAKGAPVQVHVGNHSFVFQPGEVKMVTRAFDWNRVLKNEHSNGHPLFEIVPETATEAEEQLEPSDVQMGTQGINADDIEAYPHKREVSVE